MAELVYALVLGTSSRKGLRVRVSPKAQKNMTGYFYLLLSLKDKKTYSGSTDDLNKRFNEHKKGRVKSTKNRLPVELLYSKKYATLEEARYAERYYKSCAGRKKLKEILKNSM